MSKEKRKTKRSTVAMSPQDLSRLHQMAERHGWSTRVTTAVAVELLAKASDEDRLLAAYDVDLEQLRQRHKINGEGPSPSLTEDVARQLIEADCLPGWIERGS